MKPRAIMFPLSPALIWVALRAPRAIAFAGGVTLWTFTACFPAHAKERHLLFEAYWGGLHAGDFSMSLGEITQKDHSPYAYQFRLQTRGVTDLFLKLQIEAQAAGHTLAQDAIAETFKTQYKNRKNHRWIEIDFTADDNIAQTSKGNLSATAKKETSPQPTSTQALTGAQAASVDPDDMVDDSKIKARYRKDVTDPLSAFSLLLSHTRKHLIGGEKTFQVPILDGKRRFDLVGEYIGTTTRTIKSTKFDAYHIRVHAVPIAGFKEKNRLLWQKAKYDFYLSRDGDFVPLQIVPQSSGPIMTLIARCDTPCALPEK